MNSILKNVELAENFYKLDETPSDILKLVSNYNEREKILSDLPKYSNLPSLAKFADNIARLYKTYGKNKILIELKNQPNNTKSKALAYAFLLVFNNTLYDSITLPVSRISLTTIWSKTSPIVSISFFVFSKNLLREINSSSSQKILAKVGLCKQHSNTFDKLISLFVALNLENPW